MFVLASHKPFAEVYKQTPIQEGLEEPVIVTVGGEYVGIVKVTVTEGVDGFILHFWSIEDGQEGEEDPDLSHVFQLSGRFVSPETVRKDGHDLLETGLYCIEFFETVGWKDLVYTLMIAGELGIPQGYSSQDHVYRPYGLTAQALVAADEAEEAWS